MKYTEAEFKKKFDITLATPEGQEMFLKANATCAYHLSLIALYINNPYDAAHVYLNKLRDAGLCG